MRGKARPKGAPALRGEELRGLLAKLRASDAVQRHDLLDPNILFIATGLRISELLGLYWTDFDEPTWATLGYQKRWTPTWLRGRSHKVVAELLDRTISDE